MPQYFDQISLPGALFLVVLLLNVMPAFAPPTWITLSFVGFSMPHVSVPALALIGATAATLGRVALAKLSRTIVRTRFIDESARTNIDAIRNGLEHRRIVTFWIFLTYAFSPLPSNYLFIAYGLTTLKLRLIAFPFFVGRLASYSFWATTASALGDRLNIDSFESASYVGIYFIASQLLLVPTMYIFTRVDWRAVFEEKRLRWLRATRL
jgi:membrane protein YqaA with SNARE-associated domain